MAYEKLNLVKGGVLQQEHLEHIEDGIVNIELTPGPKGDKGDKGEPGAPGKDGAKGATGENGKDGFGTKAEYDALVARIEALEGA